MFTYEQCVKNARIRMGGRIVKCIKANSEALKQVIASSGTGQMMVYRKQMEPCVYVRPNKNKMQRRSLGEVRRGLKEQGFRVRKFGRLGLLRVIDNKPQGLCIATH